MIPFLASLVDNLGNNGFTVADAQCNNFSIQDFSNYSTSTESGHLISDFTQYRFIVLTHQSGAQYILSTLTGYNQTIPPPSSTVNTFTAPVFAGDGVYTAALYVVPTYNNAASYTANVHCVFYNGQLYQCIANTSGGNLPTNTAFWNPINQSQILSKYFSQVVSASMCNIKQCTDAAVAKAVCNLGQCNDQILCSNPCFLKATKLMLLYWDIQAALQVGMIPEAEKAFDLASSLCQTCLTC